jgi:hypothetical protein
MSHNRNPLDLSMGSFNKTELKTLVSSTDYDTFKKLIVADKSGNFVDKCTQALNYLDDGLESNRTEKKIIDKNIKIINKAKSSLRMNVLAFMESEDLNKAEGEAGGSISFYPQVTTTETIGVDQIMKSGKYVDLADLSKDDLVKMLEEKGVKTRKIGREVEKVKDAYIRVIG